MSTTCNPSPGLMLRRGWVGGWVGAAPPQSGAECLEALKALKKILGLN